MFLTMFSVVLLTANVICFVKKKYLYLFIPCMLFLPSYYGIELSESLPLITIKRIMLIIFYIYALLNSKKAFSIRGLIPVLKSKTNIYLSGYFLFRIVSNLYYITTYSDAIKAIFGLIFEQAFLIAALYLLSPDNDEIITLMKSITWFATGLFIIGIFESFSFVRPFDALYTISRLTVNDHYIRLELLRATTTMGLPNFYGNMCILVTPLIFFLSRFTNQKRYIAILVLDIFAIIHSGCRSSIIAFFMITALYFITLFKNKKDLQRALKKAACILFVTIIIISALSISSAKYKYYYVGTTKSVLNVLGFNFDLDKDSPEGVDGYGGNKEGTLSRSSQLSGIPYALSVNPFFGLGTGCQNRWEVMYYLWGKWGYFNAIDLGIVEIICSEGLLGLIGYSCLFTLLALSIVNKRKQPNSSIIDHNLALQLTVSYLLCMLSSVNMPYFLILIVFFILRTN